MSEFNLVDGDNLEPQKPKKAEPECGKKKAAIKRLTQHRPDSHEILTTKDCLNALSQIPGMMLMKFIVPAEVNALSRVYGMIMQHQQDQATRNQAGLSQPTLIEMLRKNPDLINQLAPLLTKDQFTLLVSEIQNTDNA
jgi:hypothetical protein